MITNFLQLHKITWVYFLYNQNCRYHVTKIGNVSATNDIRKCQLMGTLQEPSNPLNIIKISILLSDLGTFAKPT